ncbi:hypothetical protein E3E35_02750 [Thermococcus sp. GR7]|uniref:hypothetical protein n=1 Tax=unclassified Thermococcus TaxID=2627626 RepID=UPI00143149B1|nr:MULTISPECIES: hypothetical protein [unclassified Thermococcus]NJE46348.1 hypothetical protein [Thermococcus sp. GR7]NJE77733.1 hypothetical protein [Thermococcus sp. GR4]NJF23773.1 hypothetical protein [Thermococcus sp. GR5]
MGKLDDFFKSIIGGKEKKSELEILEEIEEYLKMKEIDKALEQIKNLEKEHNIFLALRMVIRSIVEQLDKEEQTGTLNEEDVSRTRERIKEMIPAVNALFNPRYRALLMADLAILFYRLDDELNGDLALRTAINLAENHDDIIREILMNLIRLGLLDKAGYAMKMVRDPEKLDVVLVHLAEMFYRAGEVEKAKLIIKHIASPFHKAMALYYIASIEGTQNREEALRILEGAFKLAEEVEDPDARFELMLKLYDLKHSLLGEALNLREILSRREVPPQ